VVGGVGSNTFGGGDNTALSLIVNPNNSDEIVVGLGGRIIKSPDGGINWSIVLLFNNNFPFLSDMEISPNNDSLIYTTGDYISYDFGNTWDTVNFLQGSGISFSYDLEIRSVNNTDMLYFATDKGVYKYDTLITSLNEKYNSLPVKIYPNPAKDAVLIMANANQKVTIKIYNLIGDLIYSMVEQIAENNTYVINLSDKPTGIYFLKLIIDKEIITRKIILIN